MHGRPPKKVYLPRENLVCFAQTFPHRIHFTKQEESMPKYMIQASYTADGTKGVMKEGGTKRRATVEANVKAAGGTVEAFYFAFGEADAFVIVDLPDNASAAALSMAVN